MANNAARRAHASGQMREWNCRDVWPIVILRSCVYVAFRHRLHEAGIGVRLPPLGRQRRCAGGVDASSGGQVPFWMRAAGVFGVATVLRLL